MGRRATVKSRNKYFQAQKRKRQYLRSNIGRKMEEVVSKVLTDMQNRGDIFSFVRYPPHSREDREGKDFEVTVLSSDGDKVTKEFGITISERGLIAHRLKHPHLPHLLVEPTAPDGRIANLVLGLFEND